MACIERTGRVHADDPPKRPSGQGPVVATQPDEGWSRLIYVPYRAIQSVLDNPSATAIVPLREYLRLWEAAGPGMARTGRQPAFVSESRYTARVEKDFARIQGAFVVQSVEKGWSEARVSFGEAAIGKISSENDKVIVRGLGHGAYALLVPAAGTYKLEIELSTRVRTSPDGRSFELSCPAAGITSVDLTIPEPDQAVDITPQPVVEPANAEKGQTRFKANLGSTPQIAVRWHPRVSTKPQMDLLTGVDNVLHVSIGEGVVHTDASLTYKVFRGALGQLRIAVPTGDRILDVSSPQGAIRSWKATGEPGRQLVVADLLADVSKEITVEVHTERALASGGIELAGIGEKGQAFGIHAVDVVRESGELILSRRPGIDVTVEAEKGLVRVDASEVPAAYRKPDSSFYKFYSTGIRLRVESHAVEPLVVVVNRTRVVFGDDELRVVANVRYDVTRTGIFELALKFPPELVIDSVSCPAMKAQHVDAAARRLIVTLAEKRQGAIDLVVKAHRDLPASGEVDLPVLEAENVSREEGIVQAYVPEGLELISDDSQLKGARPEPPTGEGAPARTHSAGTWSYSHRPLAIHVKTSRKPTRLTARIGTSIGVQQETASIVSTVEFDVENAALDTFRIAVPEAIADKVQIQLAPGAGAVGVKQQARDAKAVDGYVAWTIVLQQKVTGRHGFRVKYDLKPAAAAAARPAADSKPGQPGTELSKAEVVVQLPRPLGVNNAVGTERVALARVEGEASVQKDRSLSVTASATGGDVEAIDVRELKQLDQNAYLAFRYERQPVQIQLALVKYGVQEVVETVVSRALIEAVVGRDASALYRCRYQLKSSQRQRIAIDLPTGSNPLGVFLDGKAVALETNPGAAKSEGWTSYFVNVVRAKPSDEPMLLAVQFRRSLSPAPFESLGGRLKLVFPRIGAPPRENVVVQQLRTAIWVPSKYFFVQTPTDFVPESHTRQAAGGLGLHPVGPSPVDLENWIGGSKGSLIDFPAEGDASVYSHLGAADDVTLTWVNMPAYTLVVSLAIAVVAWILRRSRWETMATIVLTLALAAVLVGLVDPVMAWHIVLAARFGLVALVALWLIEWLHRASIRRTTAGRGSPPPPDIPPGVVIPPPGVFNSPTPKEG